MTDYRGIPTNYRGVRFRSRLEARWAALFDLLGWKWEYEPIDLAGYIPDFILDFRPGPVLVEVKPAFTVPELIGAAAEKVDHSGWGSTNVNDALIVGAMWDPWGPEPPQGGYPTAGAVRQQIEGNHDWDEALWHQCLGCGGPSIHHASQGWFCTVCGAYDGNAFLVEEGGAVEALWHQAGNTVRWKGKAA